MSRVFSVALSAALASTDVYAAAGGSRSSDEPIALGISNFYDLVAEQGSMRVHTEKAWFIDLYAP